MTQSLPPCPHCGESLTRGQIRSLLQSYRARQRKNPSPPPQVWSKHSETASACKCPKCNAKRAAAKAAIPPPVVGDDELTWDFLKSPDLAEYGPLLRDMVKVKVHRARKKAGQAKTTGKSADPKPRRQNARYRGKLASLKAQAERDGHWRKLQREAKRLAESEIAEIQSSKD